MKSFTAVLSSLAALAVSVAVVSEAKATCPPPPFAGQLAAADIATKYNQVNGPTTLGSTLGALVNPQAFDCQGFYQKYTSGSIWVSTETSTAMLRGAISSRLVGLTNDLGSYGYPTADQTSLADGQFVTLSLGAISQPTGSSTTNVINGPMWSKYAALDHAYGALGMLTGESVSNPALANSKKIALKHGQIVWNGAHTDWRSDTWAVFTSPQWGPGLSLPVRTFAQSTVSADVDMYASGFPPNATVNFYINTMSGSVKAYSTTTNSSGAAHLLVTFNSWNCGYTNGNACIVSVEARSGYTITASSVDINNLL